MANESVLKSVQVVDSKEKPLESTVSVISVAPMLDWMDAEEKRFGIKRLSVSVSGA